VAESTSRTRCFLEMTYYASCQIDLLKVVKLDAQLIAALQIIYKVIVCLLCLVRLLLSKIDEVRAVWKNMSMFVRTVCAFLR
jgi:hypothetical protein